MSTQPAEKVVSGQLRTDLEPLTSRFPALGKPVSAQWMSGTLGRSGVGPTRYWIDAVVVVSPDVARELRGLATTPAPTLDVIGGVAPLLPSGLKGSDALDKRFSTDRWWVNAYVAAETDTVVLVAKGD